MPRTDRTEPAPRALRLRAGVKTDPIEYRYSFPWLFRILAEEGIRHVQLGTFFEIYQLPDGYFRELRRQAESAGVEISSVFTSHRELGGFFRGDPAWEAAARRSYERLIEVGGILGARSVGSNPGSVLRDEMGQKARGAAAYLRHMKELLRSARRAGLEALTIEPMSCLAEPPALPGEIRDMMEELLAEHRAHPAETAAAGLCFDLAHGYAGRDGAVRCGLRDLLEASLPYTRELHLKNTDAAFLSTFGFGPADIARGTVDVAAARDFILERAHLVPVEELVGYLEIGGPKLGRDSTDPLLEEELRMSLRHVKEAFAAGGGAEPPPARTPEPPEVSSKRPAAAPEVLVAPSLMCADMGHLAEEIRRLEEAGCHWLHFDVMDAHFVPNMPLGLVTIEHARKLTRLPFDVHLMVEDSDFFIQKLAPIGVEYISVHVESSVHLDRTLDLIRASGARAGAALNPGTPLSALDYVLDHLDFVLIMTVNPGYAGQKLVPSAFRKIADAREYLRRHGLGIPIEVDGNVSFEHIPRMVAEGAGALVAGTSSLFHKAGTLRENMARLEEAVARGLAMRTKGERSGKDPKERKRRKP